MKRRQIIVHFGILCLVLLLGTASYIQAQVCDPCYEGHNDCWTSECYEASTNYYKITYWSESYDTCTGLDIETFCEESGEKLECAGGDWWSQAGCPGEASGQWSTTYDAVDYSESSLCCL